MQHTSQARHTSVLVRWCCRGLGARSAGTPAPAPASGGLQVAHTMPAAGPVARFCCCPCFSSSHCPRLWLSCSQDHRLSGRGWFWVFQLDCMACKAQRSSREALRRLGSGVCCIKNQVMHVDGGLQGCGRRRIQQTLLQPAVPGSWSVATWQSAHWTDAKQFCAFEASVMLSSLL